MKETSRFYSSLGLLILLNAVVKPLWIFGIDRQVQNEVGTAVYGSYFAILNLSFVLIFLLDWGITVYYSRQLAARDHFLTDYAGTFIAIKLLFALLYILVIVVVAWLSGVREWEIVFLVVLIQIFSSLFVFFRSIITSQQWFTADAWLSVLDKMLMIVVCGCLLYLPSLFGGISIRRFLVAQVCCTAFAMLAAIGLLVVKKFRFHFTTSLEYRSIFRSALPFAIIVLLMGFHSRVDGFLLERMQGAYEAGRYASAYRLLDAANMVGFLLSSFLMPYVARQWSDRADINTVVLNVRHIVVVMSITLATIAFFFAPWISRTLYHHSDTGSVEIIQWCLPALLGYSLVHVYGSVLTATSQIHAFRNMVLGSVVLNLLLNFLLIPSMGAKGSCMAALTSQLFCGVATMYYARQKLNIELNVRSWLLYIFIGATASCILYFSDKFSMDKFLAILLVGAVALIMMWMTGLIDRRKWKLTGTNL